VASSNRIKGAANGDEMMHLNGWFGHLETWLLLAGAWLALGAIMDLALGLIARVGAWRERKGK
jgi:hypothetical protein